jgi:flagellar hook assembly protein FlgD
VKGQKVRKLEIRNEKLEMKREISYSVTWDGTDSSNRPVASGVYLYRILIDGKPQAQSKMMLLK